MTARAHPAAARVALLLLAAATTVPLGGCYRYVPVTRGALPSDAELRVELTDAAALSLAPRLGEGVVALDGRAHTRDSAGMQLGVSGTVTRAGLAERWRGEPVTLAWPEIAGLRVKRIDRRRSVVLGVAIAGGAALAAAAAGREFSLNGGGRGGTSRPR